MYEIDARYWHKTFCSFIRLSKFAENCRFEGICTNKNIIAIISDIFERERGKWNKPIFLS